MTMPGQPTRLDYLSGNITVIRDPVNGKSYTGVGGRRMAIYSEDGQISFSFDIAPREIEFDGFSLDWATIDRAGTVPLLVQKGAKLRTLKMNTIVTDKFLMLRPQEYNLDNFRAISRTPQRVLVRYSRQELGAFRVTEASMKSVLREPETNSISRAEIDLTLTEASSTGADPGGQGPPPYTLASVERPSTNGRATMTVQAGDTLQSLALRAYGNPGDWTWIWRLNEARLGGVPWAPLAPVSWVYI